LAEKQSFIEDVKSTCTKMLNIRNKLAPLCWNR